jgi:hypothetical protein
MKEQVDKNKPKIVMNKHGNFEHFETHLVFKNDPSRACYGKQNEDGSIHQLTKEDIELCKKYKFPYIPIENLQSNKHNNDEINEDIDDEDDIPIEDDIDDEDVDDDIDEDN